MGHRFSIATLFLLTAIAALALASMRMTMVRVWSGETNDLEWPMAVGAIAGMMYAVGLAIWNRTGWAQPVISGVGGLLLGGAAGAQMTSPVAWPVVFAAPVVVVSIVTVIAFNRRRRRLASPSQPQSSFNGATFDRGN